MSSVTENGDVTAGKPNEEKTYKKVNKIYNLFMTCFSFHIENLSLLWVNYASELNTRTNKACSVDYLKVFYSLCETVKHFYLLSWLFES